MLNPLRPALSTESAMINSYQMQLSWLQDRAESNFIAQHGNFERVDWICSSMACRIGLVLAKQICLADGTSLKDLKVSAVLLTWFSAIMVPRQRGFSVRHPNMGSQFRRHW